MRMLKKKSCTRFPDRTIGSSLPQNSSVALTHEAWRLVEALRLVETLQLVEALQLVKALQLVETLERIRNPQPPNWQGGLAHGTTRTQNQRSSKTTIESRFYARDAAGHAVVQAIVRATIAV